MQLWLECKKVATNRFGEFQRLATSGEASERDEQEATMKDTVPEVTARAGESWRTHMEAQAQAEALQKRHCVVERRDTQREFRWQTTTQTEALTEELAFARLQWAA